MNFASPAATAGSAIPVHKDSDGVHVPHEVDLLDTIAVWAHSLVALAWVALAGVIAVLALPAARRLLTPTALRYLDARLETVVRLSGLLTVLLVITGIYNLKQNTPYPTPWLSASPTEVLELPDATPYFLLLTGKIVVYGVMLLAAAYLIARARELAADEGVDRAEDEDLTEPGTGGAAAPQAGGGGVATLARSTSVAPASGRATRTAIWVFVGGLLTVLLSLSWLRTYHLVIEGTPDETGVLSAHDGVPQPLFSAVAVKPDGRNAWLVSLTLTDHASQLPPPSVYVTVTGTGPDGSAVGPLDFAETTTPGVYQGRIAGAPGTWSLLAVTEARPDFEVAPTRQSFSVALEPAPADADTNAGAATGAKGSP